MKKDLHFELRERIKELSCLYTISKISQQNEKQLTVLLNEICHCIPSGWSYPEKAVARIILDGVSYTSSVIPEPGILQFSEIIIESESRGRVEVHYSVKGKNNFIEEEQQLIDKIALEVSGLAERHEKRQKQELLERRLRHNDRLSVLGELTAGIAHELNTPVGNILGYAQLLLGENKNEKTRRDLEKIIASAIHSREIIKKLMFFSCEMPTQFEQQDFNRMVKDSLRLLHAKFESANIKITVTLDENIPLARFDTIQITQVIFNLVINAIHAMPQGGQLYISTTYKKSAIELRVRDNGKGIAPGIIEKIFQPFFTTKPLGEGTGLGLSVVHGIVKSHNGKINVVSGENQGTEFILEFPVK